MNTHVDKLIDSLLKPPVSLPASELIKLHGDVAVMLHQLTMNKCDIPPKGWMCTRTKGHTGPCAAYPASSNSLQDVVDAAVQPYRDAMQKFVDRCDNGEIRSARTYAEFKELLAK